MESMATSDKKIEAPKMFDWAYKGVDFDLAGNGGVECRDFISLYQRIAESVLATVFAGCVAYLAISNITLPEKISPTDRIDRCGKRILLVVMCLTFGIELGFKFATKQMIYVLNPCHIATMIQIFCLAAPPSRLVTSMFRFQLHMMPGPPIAILFPVINTRLLPFETEVYYIQHILMIIIPMYLLTIGGVYTAEPVRDFRWAGVSVGILYVYHFIPLQYLAYTSLVNLNNMLCPAVSDPFYGQWYRLFAMTHQAIFLPLIGKLVVWSFQKLGLIKPSPIKEVFVFKGGKSVMQKDTDMESSDLIENQKLNGKNGVYSVSYSHSNNANNGHVKSS